MYFYRVVVCMTFLQLGLLGGGGKTKTPAGGGNVDEVASCHVLRDDEQGMQTEVVFTYVNPFVIPTLKSVCPVVQKPLRIAENPDNGLLHFLLVYSFSRRKGDNDSRHPLYYGRSCCGRCTCCRIHNLYNVFVKDFFYRVIEIPLKFECNVCICTGKAVRMAQKCVRMAQILGKMVFCRDQACLFCSSLLRFLYSLGDMPYLERNVS